MRDELWGGLEDYVVAGRGSVDETCAALQGALDRHFEGVSDLAGRNKKAQARIAASEADLLRHAAALRSRFRRALIEGLPAECGADRPTLEELERYLPSDPLRVPGVRETVSVPRSALAAAIAALICGLVPAVLVAPVDPKLALGLSLLCATLGAGVAVWVTCAPLSARARRWLFGGAVAVGAGVVLLHAVGGFGALFASLRGRGGRKRSLIVAGALALLFTLRVWGRRVSFDASDVNAARESILAEFRQALLADLRFLGLLAAEARRRPADLELPALREKWKALQVDVAQAARHPERTLDGDLLARLTEMLGVPLESRSRVDRFVWTGSAEDKDRYVPRGLIAPGQRVRVTRAPVEERSDNDGELRVVTRGEVIPDDS